MDGFPNLNSALNQPPLPQHSLNQHSLNQHSLNQHSLNQGWVYCDRILPHQAGLTVLDYYSQRYRHSSRTTWQQRIHQGQIQLDGHPVDPQTPLSPGQQLTYHRPPWAEPTVPLDFTVIYADDDLIVVNKPAGLPVLPGGGFLTHTLLHQLQQHYPQPTPVPVHRLGRGTSGLLLLARSPLAKTRLSQQLRHSTADPALPQAKLIKTYRALIAASILPDHFSLTQPIGKLPHPELGYVWGAAPQSPHAKPAHSQVQVLERTAHSTLLAVTIPTGRPHQIRIHLAAAGYPLLGDPLYLPGGIPRLQPSIPGDKLPVPGDIGYHLHAHHLQFSHPRSNEPLDFHAPLPPDLTLSTPERC
jgi:23S rRNA pseudouridine1911/1915/1917 synthase